MTKIWRIAEKIEKKTNKIIIATFSNNSDTILYTTVFLLMVDDYSYLLDGLRLWWMTKPNYSRA